MLFAVCFMQVWYGNRRSTVNISTVGASSPTPLMLDHEEVVRDLKKALQRAHVRNKNVKKQLVRSQQSQQRATDIIASLRKYSDATKKRLASILLRKRAEPRLKNVYKQKYIYTYKRAVCVCLFVCWFVCLLFIGHTTFVHFAALPPSTPRAAKPSRATPRASGQAHAQREHARACRTTSQRKNRCADAFQEQIRTRAHAVVYVTAEIFKKRDKEKQHATSQVQFTVCLLLECLLFESY